jgi:hypothetical protein
MAPIGLFLIPIFSFNKWGPHAFSLVPLRVRDMNTSGLLSISSYFYFNKWGQHRRCKLIHLYELVVWEDPELVLW